GLTGQMYKQFAVTIAISVAISGLVALTLSPALCRLILKPGHGDKKNIFYRSFDRLFGWITAGYTAGVRLAIRGALVTLLIFGLLCFAAWRMSGIVPGGLLPEEDQGVLLAAVMLPEGSSLD